MSGYYACSYSFNHMFNFLILLCHGVMLCFIVLTLGNQGHEDNLEQKNITPALLSETNKYRPVPPSKKGTIQPLHLQSLLTQIPFCLSKFTCFCQTNMCMCLNVFVCVRSRVFSFMCVHVCLCVCTCVRLCVF